MPKIYDSVQVNHPPRNRFDLSQTHFLTAKVGMLYPVLCKEVYPGDVFRISNAVHCELQPMVAPLLSDLNIFAHTFFVPYRLIYGVDNSDGKSIWEKYITGGDDGDYNTPLPSWNPSWTSTSFSADKIWDSVGFPMDFSSSTSTDSDGNPVVSYSWSPIVPVSLNVSQAPMLAYNFIYNNFYIDENLQTEVALTNEDLLYANWRKDYFTSALESQTFGTAPAMPISGNLPVSFASATAPILRGSSVALSSLSNYQFANLPSTGLGYRYGSNQFNKYDDTLITPSEGATVSPLSVDLSSVSATASASAAATFGVADMRLAFAIQRLLELTMLTGHRYTEWLHAHFGVSPSDARLDRPEYIGGTVFPVNVGVNIQSSGTASGSTPQGNKVGTGSVNDVLHVGNYRVEEYGVIMTLMSIRPKPIYSQGIPREFLRQTRFDYYSPEFANLSEQGIYNAELYVDPNDSSRPDNGLFGYQAHWNELRCSNNFVSGAMREQFDYWTMTRKFSSRPALNDDFITLGHPNEYNRIWAVQDEDQFIVAWSNIIDAFRPIPALGTPGLIDHVYGGR